MSDVQLGAVVRHIRRLAVPLDTQDLSDVQLLDRFTRQREESAFAALMRRHGGLVWGVCRHVLRQEQDAEDAFQATFLVLADKAGVIRKREALACWLHGTAYRIAMTVRREAMRRKARETKAAGERPAPAPECAWQELQAALDEEVQRLPQRQRAVFVLCALEGKSQVEAAGELGWQLGTVASTLARGRARLRSALARRGVTLTAVLAGLAVVGLRADAAPVALAGATLRAAVVGAAAADVPARVTALARSATQGLSLPVKVATALVLLAATVGAGAAFRPNPAEPPPPAKEAAPQARAGEAKEDKGGEDTALLESPLPGGAFARLGTSRFRHAHIVAGVVFAPDGKFIATGSHMGTVRLWDPATGKELRSWQAHDGGAIGLAVSPDSKMIATGSWDNSIRVWDANGKLLRTMLGHAKEVSRLAFSPDGKVLASGSKDGTVRLWDAATGAALSTITAHASEVRGIAYSPDGKHIATAGADKLVYVWDAESGKRLVTCEGHTDEVLSVAYSPDGKLLATSSKDGTSRLWDSATGKGKRSMKNVGWQERVAFSPDGKWLAVASGWGGLVNLWDLTTEGDKTRWSAKMMNSVSVAFSPDGKKLVGCGWEAGVRVWDVATGKEEDTAADGHTSWVTGLALSPDGKTLVSISTDWSVIVWDLVRGRQVRRLTGHTDRAYSVAVSPDGKTIASGARDKTIRLWDMATGREVKKIEAAGLVHGLSFSSDGKRLASCSGNDTYDGWVLEVPGHNATVWDVATGTPALRLTGHDGGVKSIAWSPDGKTLATGGNDKTVRLWDAGNGKELRRLEGNTEPVESVAVAPDGRRVAAAGQDGVLRVWRTDGDDKPTPFGTTHGRLMGVAFSPDGRSLVTANRQPGTAFKSALVVWDMATGKERLRFAGHQNTASAVAFAPEGRVLISGGGDGTVLLWDVTGRAENGKFVQAELSPPSLESEWADLTAEDMGKVQKAIWALAAAPKQALPLLREVLKPAAPTDAARIARLIKELDDDSFEKRESASAELAKVGEPAAAALRKALDGTPSAELRVRVTTLLEGFGGKGTSADVVRRERAMEVLEHIGGSDAKALLEELAKGAPDATLTQEAKAALKRLSR